VGTRHRPENLVPLVRALDAAGVLPRDTARLLGIGRRTVWRILAKRYHGPAPMEVEFESGPSRRCPLCEVATCWRPCPACTARLAKRGRRVALGSP